MDSNSSAIIADATAEANALAAAQTTIATLNADLALLTANQFTPVQLAELAAALNPMRAYTNLETQTWTERGDAGDSGGGSTTTASGTFLQTPGAQSIWSVAGGFAYNNPFWNNTLEVGATALPSTRLIQMLDIMYPTAADKAAAQAQEFECQQNWNNLLYNRACQFNFVGANLGINTFNYAASHWEPTGVALDPTWFLPGQFTRIAMVSTRGYDGTIKHNSISVNGKFFALNITRAAVKEVSQPYIKAGFQPDSSAAVRGTSVPPPYRVITQNMHVITA